MLTLSVLNCNMFHRFRKFIHKAFVIIGPSTTPLCRPLLCDTLCISTSIASSRSQIKEERKTSLAETKDHGDGLNSHRNRDVGVLAALRTVLFGARDPESDLSIEMLEELHMVTGCKLALHLAGVVGFLCSTSISAIAHFNGESMAFCAGL